MEITFHQEVNNPLGKAPFNFPLLPNNIIIIIVPTLDQIRTIRIIQKTIIETIIKGLDLHSSETSYHILHFYSFHHVTFFSLIRYKSRHSHYYLPWLCKNIILKMSFTLDRFLSFSIPPFIFIHYSEHFYYFCQLYLLFVARIINLYS